MSSKTTHEILPEHVAWMKERFPDAEVQRIEREVSLPRFTYELMRQMDDMCMQADTILQQAEAMMTAQTSDEENEGKSND